MGVSEFEQKCFEVLDDDSIFEEDRVDKVDNLVKAKYSSMSSAQRQKIVMNILWKHQDPSKRQKPTIVNVKEVETKIDIPDLERRLQLEKQFKELDSMIESSRQKPKPQHTESEPSQKAEEKKYEDLLRKTNDLKQELYGDNERPLAVANVSPIDYISSFFSGQVSRARINQTLKASGYSVLDAVELLIDQLKKEQSVSSIEAPQQVVNEPFFDPTRKNKAICTFLLKHGQCLRSDCQFSHEIEQRVCSFWLNGRCVAGDSCVFKHSLDDLSGYNAPQITSTYQESPIPDSAFPPLGASTQEQFPALGSTPVTSSKSKKKFNATSAATFSPASSIGSIPAFIPSNTPTPPTSQHAYSPTPVTSAPKSAAIAIVKPLRKPKLIPWESEDNEHLKSYMTHRTNAIKYESQRRKFAQMSTDAWRSNDGAKSKQLSDKANKFEQGCFDSLKLADDELYNYSETTNDELWFEFHGLEFNEAIEQLSYSLKEVKSKSKKESTTVYIVVPSISYDHAEYKKTTKPLSLWLDHEGYRWQLHSCGNGQYGSIIAIDPWST